MHRSDLEDELGKQLLIRGSKKVTLTEDGMLLRKRAEEMIGLMEKQKQTSPVPMKISMEISILEAEKQTPFPFWHRLSETCGKNIRYFQKHQTSS